MDGRRRPSRHFSAPRCDLSLSPPGIGFLPGGETLSEDNPPTNCGPYLDSFSNDYPTGWAKFVFPSQPVTLCGLTFDIYSKCGGTTGWSGPISVTITC